jgi:hypothetical protein
VARTHEGVTPQNVRDVRPFCGKSVDQETSKPLNQATIIPVY